MSEFDTFATQNQFGFSTVPMDSLDASEYTIVNMLVDESGSVGGFKTELNNAMNIVMDSCEKHPKSENLLLRTAAFSSMGIREIHGFSTLTGIDRASLAVSPTGSTPLWDATLDSVETTEAYAKSLNDQDYFCNGIIFVVTDGGENASRTANMAKIKTAVDNIRLNESLESIKMILVGVNDNNGSLSSHLTSFKDDAGFDEYISVDNVDAGSLAKLAQFISQSISSTSQSLGTGGPSQAVNFTL